jgi:hypothetical protein
MKTAPELMLENARRYMGEEIEVSDIADTRVPQERGAAGSNDLAWNPKTDQVGEVWFVTRATKTTTLEDMVFKANLGSLMRQAMGGLKAGEVIGVFKDENEARKMADVELRDVNGEMQDTTQEI